MRKYHGILNINKFGFGKIINNELKKIIKVDKNDINNNFNEQKVIFIIKKETKICIYAKIISEPNFKNIKFSGIIHHKHKNNIFLYNVNIGKNNLVMCDNNENMNKNDYVIFEIKQYKNNFFYGKIINHLGIFNDNNALTKYIINLYNLNEDFDFKIIKKTNIIKNQYEKNKEYEEKIRTNLCHLNTFTIDPIGAKDLDDAISIQKINNNFKLYIHIADVSHFVKQNSIIDKECLKRSFSVYLPNKVIRMLPPILSEDLCSLLPNENKYAVTTEVDIDKYGNIIDYKFYKSIIQSDYKYTYEEVYDILENNKNNTYLRELKLLYEISNILNKKRLRLPEIEINNFEANLKFSDYTHNMIEEVMILNNILISKFLSQKKILHPSRVHNIPNIEIKQHLLKKLSLKDNFTIDDIQNIFKQNSLSKEKKILHLFYIQRLLEKANYDFYKKGHWALDCENYSHFTSPIRRYSDLLLHRILFNEKIKENKMNQFLNIINENEKKYQKIKFVLEKFKIFQNFYSLDLNNDNNIIRGYIIDCYNPTVTIFLPNINITKDLHISQLSKNKLNYCEIERKFFDNDNNIIIKDSDGVSFFINKINFCFLDLDLKINFC